MPVRDLAERGGGDHVLALVGHRSLGRRRKRREHEVRRKHLQHRIAEKLKPLVVAGVWRGLAERRRRQRLLQESPVDKPIAENLVFHAEIIP